MTPENGSEALPTAALVRAVRHLLRPLVRLLLAHGGTYPFLSALLKGLYLDVARAELERSGERATASRLSLMTGVHRKDVRRLSEPDPESYTPPPSVSLGARLVARWTGEPAFSDATGQPLPLPRQAEAGPSFETLVSAASTDIRPRAVLDEWLRLGLVELDGDDLVRLRTDAFVPRAGFDEKAHFLGRNVHDHLAAASHNLDHGPPMLERSVYYDGLDEESVSELGDLAERLGMEALRGVNRRALVLQHRDAERPGPRHRINFGVFFFRNPSDEERDEDA